MPVDMDEIIRAREEADCLADAAAVDAALTRMAAQITAQLGDSNPLIYTVMNGGLILAVSVALWYIRRIGLPLWTTCDVFAPGIALGHVVGRLGCFFAGCCYGKPADLPWAVTFTDPFAGSNVGTPLNVPLHPTQLYEAGAEAAILALLLSTEARGRRFPGRTFWLYLLLYAISRYVIEIFRGDPRGGPIGIFSPAQFISVILAPLSVLMLFYLSRRARAHTNNWQSISR